MTTYKIKYIFLTLEIFVFALPKNIRAAKAGAGLFETTPYGDFEIFLNIVSSRKLYVDFCSVQRFKKTFFEFELQT